MDAVSAIFASLGGPAAVGRIIGKPVEHATLMRRRRSIPVAYWPALIEATKGSKAPITYEALVEAHQRPANRDTPRLASGSTGAAA